MARILRKRQLYGPTGRINVGKTTFDEDYVYHHGGEEYVSGTKVRRLKPVKLGERATGFFEDEVDALVEGLRAERGARG